MKEFFIVLILLPLWLARKLFSADYRLYWLMCTGWLQTPLASIGRLRAEAAFLKAKRTCPAYQKFLKDQGYEARFQWKLQEIPVMTKENYVKKYSLEDRCYHGMIPLAGVVIDESSGSSGKPNNWVRSKEEREDVKHVLQLNYRLIYRGTGRVLLNCFALGPWATGMNVSMSLVDVGILKSIGPDKQKLENTLEMFSTRYSYIICGYPPFIKSFVDETRLDLKEYKMDLIVGGEGT